MRYLAGFVLIVLLVTFPSCKYFKGGLFGKKADTMAVWQIRQDSTRIADSIRVEQDRFLALENAKVESARLAEEEKAAWEKKFRYNIIVGSFVTPEYAKGLAEDYREKGFQSRIIKMEGSRFELVAAESHESFRKAVARLKEFQDTVQLDSWMYIKK